MSAGKPLAVAFGRIVRELRASVPQVVLANAAGIRLDRLAALEAGADDPTLEEIWRLAHALDVRPATLVQEAVHAAEARGARP